MAVFGTLQTQPSLVLAHKKEMQKKRRLIKPTMPLRVQKKNVLSYAARSIFLLFWEVCQAVFRKQVAVGHFFLVKENHLLQIPLYLNI